VQRLRVHPGWNLLSVAVTAERGGAQLAATGLTESIYQWNPVTRAFAVLSPNETLAAGTVLWVNATDAGTLRVTGVYPGPKPNLRGPPEGNFIPGHGLEAWPTDALVAHPSLALWRFAPDLQNWQTKLPLPNLKFSDLPAALAPHEAVFAKAPASADLEAPDPALSVRFYHQDHLGSSSVMSDGVGALVEESANFPFGSPRSEFRPRGLREDYQFTQKERDGESGLDYFEARYLMRAAGRFFSTDPILNGVDNRRLFSPQVLNSYAYCRSQPIRLFDPTGMEELVVGYNIGGNSKFANCSALAEKRQAKYLELNVSVLGRDAIPSSQIPEDFKKTYDRIAYCGHGSHHLEGGGLQPLKSWEVSAMDKMVRGEGVGVKRGGKIEFVSCGGGDQTRYNTLEIGRKLSVQNIDADVKVYTSTIEGYDASGEPLRAWNRGNVGSYALDRVRSFFATLGSSHSQRADSVTYRNSEEKPPEPLDLRSIMIMAR